MNFWDRLNNGQYKFVFLIGAIGGILGLIQKHKLEHCKEKGLKCYLLGGLMGIITSIFVGYIGFEVAFYIFGKIGISIACGGLSAWAGTDAIVLYEKKLVEFLGAKRSE